MTENDRKPTGHRLTVIGREKVEISGVTEVESFDSESVVLLTALGELTLEGSELKVGTLDIARGAVEVTGHLDSAVYTAERVPKRKLRERFFS